MAKSVAMMDGAWFAFVWDKAAVNGQICPEAAMIQRQFETEEQARFWAESREKSWIESYRARCAWGAGLPCLKRDWAQHYQRFAEYPEIYGPAGEPPG